MKNSCRTYLRLRPWLCAALLVLLVDLRAGAAAGFLDGGLRELVWLNFSGRATESFERVSSMLSNDPSNYAAYLIRANCYGWFTARNPENRRYDNQLLESLEACIENAGRIDPDSSEYTRALYFQALALAVEARFKMIRGYNFSARWSTRAVKAAADELAERAGDNVDARLPLAIFHASWGGSPLWARMAQFALLLPRGQRDQGVRTLEEIAERGEDSRLWADVVLLNVYSEDPDMAQKALEKAERLHNLFPDNSVIQQVLGDSYRKQGRWVLAEAVYRSIGAKVASRLPGYDDVVFEVSRLRTIECQINLGKMDEAFEGVKSILVSNPIQPEWIVPWAHFFAAKIYLHQGHLRRAERAIQYALDGDDYDDLHRTAKDQLEAVRKLLEKQKDNE